MSHWPYIPGDGFQLDEIEKRWWTFSDDDDNRKNLTRLSYIYCLYIFIYKPHEISCFLNGIKVSYTVRCRKVTT